MKMQLFRYLVIAGLATSSHAQGLDVHEWGTFTILHNSSGMPIHWYQPLSDLAKLPPFVKPNIMGMKSAVGQNVMMRMETPVIYFYPDQEMDITVEANLLQGRITEVFPHCVFQPDTFSAKWVGRLLPPTDPAAALIPHVTATTGENYAAARNVPEAWLFRVDALKKPNQKVLPVAEVEKFIFYRGSGNVYLGLTPTLSKDGQLTLRNGMNYGAKINIALKVTGETAVWKQIPELPAYTNTNVTMPSATISFNQTPQALDTVEKELIAFFNQTLQQSGLTKAEAAAMVATWDHTWFREPGQRVLTILDPTLINKMLSLSITPKPNNIERVFVARLEVVDPHTEENMRLLLSGSTPINTHTATDYKQLNLGRFSSGVQEIAIQKQALMMRNRHAMIREEIKKNPKTARH